MSPRASNRVAVAGDHLRPSPPMSDRVALPALASWLRLARLALSVLVLAVTLWGALA